MRAHFQRCLVSGLESWASRTTANRITLSEYILTTCEKNATAALGASSSASFDSPLSPSSASVISSQRNKYLHEQVQLWSKVLSQFPGNLDEFLAQPEAEINRQLEKLSQKYLDLEAMRRRDFLSIKDHHLSLVDKGWVAPSATSASPSPFHQTSLERYGLAAVNIGQKPWAKISHQWILHTLQSFFRKKGMQRELWREYQELNLSPPPRLCPGTATETPLHVLDVGSCNDPLSQLLQTELKTFPSVEVTAIDLHPMCPQVYPCDLLAVNVTGLPSPETSLEEKDGERKSKSCRPYSTQQQLSLGGGSTVTRLLELPARSYHAVSLALVLSYLPTPYLRYQMILKAHELLFHPPSLLSSSLSDPPPYRYGVLVIVDTFFSSTKHNWISSLLLEDETPTEELTSTTTYDSFTNQPRPRDPKLVSWVPVVESIGFKLLKAEVIRDSQIHKRATIGFFFRTISPEEKLQRRREGGSVREFHSSPHWSRRARRALSFAVPPHQRKPLGIIGAGIGGATLSYILHQHGIPHLLFDRDESISSRPQGYAVTIQQGISVLRSIGITTSVVESSYNQRVCSLQGVAGTAAELKSEPIVIPHCTISRSHVSFNRDGRLLGVFGPPSLSAPGSVPYHLSYPTAFLDFSPESWSPEVDGLVTLSESQRPKNVRQNIHMPRQALRDTLLTNSDPQAIRWNHKFSGFRCSSSTSSRITAHFQNHCQEYELSGLVGCDGIYSPVRRLLLEKFQNHNQSTLPPPQRKDPLTPAGASFHERNLSDQLSYLGLFVILGIAPRSSSEIAGIGSSTNRRKVQWLDGATRVFSMPYDEQHDMWQLSFPMTTEQVLQFQSHVVSSAGQDRGESRTDSHRSHFSSKQLKELALTQCSSWHPTLTAMLQRTSTTLISGHPAYDRDPIDLFELRRDCQLPITLLGDSWHPMSPFKAQGANQALLDALALSKQIIRWWTDKKVTSANRVSSGGSLAHYFGEYEVESFGRSAKKVIKSRLAAQYLHSPAALVPGNITRASVAEHATQ
jgi:salicylate hydroxylase